MYLETFFYFFVLHFYCCLCLFYIYNLDPDVYIVKTNCAFQLFLKEIVFYLYETKGTYYD